MYAGSFLEDPRVIFFFLLPLAIELFKISTRIEISHMYVFIGTCIDIATCFQIMCGMNEDNEDKERCRDAQNWLSVVCQKCAKCLAGDRQSITVCDHRHCLTTSRD